MSDRNPEPSPTHPQTTFQVRNAVQGDAQSLDWVVDRLSPLLLTQAEYRLGPALRTQVDPQDLVNEAWVITLPRLGELSMRDGRMTPVLLKYLTTTMNYRIGRMLRRRTGARSLIGGADLLGEVSAEITGVPTRVERRELHERVRECLEELPPRDREIIILRGIEQHASKDVAQILEVTPMAVDQRYSRALKRLRERLPRSVFAELDDA